MLRSSAFLSGGGLKNMKWAMRTLATGGAEPIRTALYDLHTELGGKIVDFAGYALPVQYNGLGIKKEHLHCRSKGCASLFDVSHMGQIKWYGADRVQFLEKVVVGDVAGLKPNEGRLTLIVNEKGTIVDDAVLCNAGDHIYMVVNGACKYKDMNHFREYMASADVNMEYMGDTEQALLALQGDGAKDVISALISFDLATLPFMNGIYTKVGGFDTRLTRCGYTGEDGFEISVAAQDAIPLAKLLLASDQASVQPCGLGARDSLRLEAGLCLYGHDLDEDITPVQGTLVWTIGPPGSRRRMEPTFLGAEHILTKEGKPLKVEKKRVGLAGHKTPAREGAKIFHEDQEVGQVTSGTISPSLNKPLAMGYVNTDLAKAGTDLTIEVRGKRVPTQVSKMPFVPTRYWRVPE